MLYQHDVADRISAIGSFSRGGHQNMKLFLTDLN